MSILAHEGYISAHSVFFFRGKNLTDNLVMQLLFQNLERLCLPRESKLPSWNVTLAWLSLTCTPFEPLMLSERHLTFKMCYFLEESVSFMAIRKVNHLRPCSSCTFSFASIFVTKMQNLALMEIHFDEFTIPCLKDFVDRNREEVLLCPVRARTVGCYLLSVDQHHLTCIDFYIFTGRKKKFVARNTISFWLRSVISGAFELALDSDLIAVKAKAHEARSIDAKILF